MRAIQRKVDAYVEEGCLPIDEQLEGAGVDRLFSVFTGI